MRNLNKIKMKYEFKLDSRQIVLIFVGFLMVALGIFAAGVSTGKQLAKVTATPQEENLLEELQEKEKQLDEAQEILTQKVEEKAEEKTVTKEEKKLPTTKKEKTAEKKQVAQKTKKVEQKAEPKPEPKPEPKQEEKKAPKKSETQQSKKATEKKSDAGETKAPTGRYYTLQMASLPTMEKAKEYIKNEFKAFDKRKPFVTPVAIADRGTWYRVKIGKFDTKEQAMAYQSIFEARTEMQTMLVLENN